MIVKIGTIFIINIDIKDKLVIIIPLGVIVILNTLVEVLEIKIIEEIGEGELKVKENYMKEDVKIKEDKLKKLEELKKKEILEKLEKLEKREVLGEIE